MLDNTNLHSYTFRHELIISKKGKHSTQLVRELNDCRESNDSSMKHCFFAADVNCCLFVLLAFQNLNFSQTLTTWVLSTSPLKTNGFFSLSTPIRSFAKRRSFKRCLQNGIQLKRNFLENLKPFLVVCY